MWRLVPALVAQMGAAFPELPRAAGADRGDAAQRGDPLQGHARPRPAHPRRRARAPARGRAAARRRRLPALRHLRLPARPDPGRAARAAAAASTSPASRRRWPSRRRRRAPPGPAPARRPTRRIWFDLAERHGPTEFLGYDTETAEGQVLALVVGGHAVETAPVGDRGAGRAEPDAVLRRIRRPGRRHRHAAHRPRPRRDHRRAQEGRASSSISAGSTRASWSAAPRPSSPSTTTAAPRSAPTTRRPTCCTRRCAGRSATTSRSAAASSPPTGCASTSPTARR